MLQSKCQFYINCQYHTDIIKSVKLVTHDAAVFFIIHFLHLQAVRLKDTKKPVLLFNLQADSELQ